MACHALYIFIVGLMLYPQTRLIRLLHAACNGTLMEYVVSIMALMLVDFFFYGK